MRRLVLTTETGEKIVHELSDELITVGRAPDNMIRIDDGSVSGRHAHFQLVGSTYHLKDLESTNGSRVNGQPVTDIALRPADQIRFGRVEACYECDPDAAAQPLPRLEEVVARPAESSARPVDFANASPFPQRARDRDPSRTIIFAAAALAFLAFVSSMIAVITMHGPDL